MYVGLSQHYRKQCTDICYRNVRSNSVLHTDTHQITHVRPSKRLRLPVFLPIPLLRAQLLLPRSNEPSQVQAAVRASLVGQVSRSYRARLLLRDQRYALKVLL